jgi:hypothetical protein
MHSSRFDSPAFVIGCIRSGTTLLAELLGQSPGIVHCPFELKHIWSSVGGVPMASPRTRDTICEASSATEVRPGQAEALSRAFVAEMRKHSAGKRSDALFLNKNPHLSYKLPMVDALFPDARFIWISRPFPQVVASIKRLFEQSPERSQTWHYWPTPNPQRNARCWYNIHQKEFPNERDLARVFPGGNISYFAEYWLETNRAVADYLGTLPDERGLMVLEEDLIRDPDAEIARCLAFLGQPAHRSFDLNRTVDPTRNEGWEAVLSEQEHMSLQECVNTHQSEIEAILALGIRKRPSPRPSGQD